MMDRRSFVTTGAAIATTGATMVAGAQSPVSGQGASASQRRIITVEEAWAWPGYMEAMAKGPLATTEMVETRSFSAIQQNSIFSRALTDTSLRLEIMDAYGIDLQILSLVAPGVQIFQPADGVRMARAANDRMAETIRLHPTRFAGLGTVAPQDPKAAAAEITRATTELSLNGIIINSHTGGEYLDHEKYFPIFEAASDLKVPLYIHPRTPLPQIADAFNVYGMTGALWGFGADTGLHAARLILSGLFDRFPDLTIVLGHMGEALPFWIARMDTISDLLARMKISDKLHISPLKHKPSHYLNRNFYITTSGMGTMPVLACGMAVMGIERVIYAIDYPFEDTKSCVEALNSFSLTPVERSLLEHGNAERVFGIKSRV